MPHLIVEYSANVDAARGGPVEIGGLVAALHDAALATGTAAADALRTRGVAREHYAIADRHPDNKFVAVTVRLAAGRGPDERRHLVEALTEALESYLGDAVADMMLSVECHEIDPAARINRNHVRERMAERAAGHAVQHLEET